MEVKIGKDGEFYSCPFVKLCGWKGTKEELCLHFEFYHNRSFTREPTFDLSAPNSVSFRRNVVMKCFENIFLLQFKLDVQSAKFWCGVRYIGEHTQARDFFYALLFLNNQNHKKIQKFGEMQLDCDWDYHERDMVEFDLNDTDTKVQKFNVIFNIFCYRDNNENVLISQNEIAHENYEHQAKSKYIKCLHAHYAMEKTNIITDQIYTCPSVYRCIWQGRKDELCSHFKLRHSISFTCKPRFKWSIPNLINFQRNIVMKCFENIFLLQLEMDVQSAKLWCGVQYIGDRTQAASFFYTLFVLDEVTKNKIHKFGETQLDCDWGFYKHAMAEIDLNNDNSKGHTLFIFFNIIPSRDTGNNKNVLKNQMKCPVCLKKFTKKEKKKITVDSLWKGYYICSECEENFKCNGCLREHDCKLECRI